MSHKGEVIPITDFRKQRYLQWLTTPPGEREPKKLTDLADELGLTRRTLTNWKTVDKEFIEAWEKLYLKTIGNPGRKQEIMDTLFATATDQDDPKHVAAAKQYFEIEGSMKPQEHKIRIERDPKELSDEDLEKAIASRVVELKDRKAAS